MQLYLLPCPLVISQAPLGVRKDLGDSLLVNQFYILSL